MPIKDVVEILNAYKRYVDYMNNYGHDEVIDAIKVNGDSLLVTMRGHMGETYEQEVYFSKSSGELCVDIAGRQESVFDYMEFEENDAAEVILNYIKFGK